MTKLNEIKITLHASIDDGEIHNVGHIDVPVRGIVIRTAGGTVLPLKVDSDEFRKRLAEAFADASKAILETLESPTSGL